MTAYSRASAFPGPRPRRAALSICMSLAAALGADARPNVSGDIVNQTWGPGDGTYIVTGDITVPAGASLTIQPFTTVLFNHTDALAAGIDPTRIEFTVKGTLTVTGNAANPVLFKAWPNPPAPVGAWRGIIIDPAAASASLGWADIRDAITAVESHAPGAVLQMTRAFISHCRTGLLINDGSPAVSGATVSGCLTGAAVLGGASPAFTNCYFYENCAEAVLVSTAGPGTTTLTHATIDSSGGYGVRNSGAGPVALNNCIVARSGGAGVCRDSGAGAITTNTCCFSTNAVADYLNASPGPGSFSWWDPGNPFPGKPALHAQSACVNAANPAYCPATDLFGNPRPYGPACDIGAAEFGACPPPMIAQQPAGTGAKYGWSWSLSVGASGTGLAYQWEHGETQIRGVRGISGENTPTLTATTTDGSDGGSWRVIVSNDCGSAVLSNWANVSLNAACAADFNRSGGVTAQDIFDFLTAFFQGCN